ncbi:copper resistance CopC family protein [Streptomyces caniscabiei]|uniref:copper resistance CopC family protein n=1 Tax=Streptomyces caniscabiei TaxID=2746961 RepID=UPI001F3697AC|nr:copper resistance protein CopC [Streptomyces caniscabiei]
MSHLHAQSCSAKNGGDHFQFEKDGATTPPNEVHLMFTADKSGMGMTTVNNDRKTGEDGRQGDRRPPLRGTGQPDRMRGLRVLRATTVLSGCLGVLLFLGGTPARAHTALEDASPGPGDTVGPGAEVVSAFGRLKSGTTPKIGLVGPDGTTVPVGSPVVADGSVTCAAVAGLPTGVNTLTYTITSADGDTQSSAFQFEVAKGAATAKAASACQKSSLEAPDTGAGAGSDTAEDDAFLGLGRTTALSLLSGVVVVIAGAGFLTVRTVRGTRTTAKGEATT